MKISVVTRRTTHRKGVYMKRFIFGLILFFAPVLFLIGAMLPFTALDGDGVGNSRMIVWEIDFVFTIFGSVTMVVIVGFFGAALLMHGEGIKRLYGKTMYMLAALFALVMFILHMDMHSDDLEGAHDPSMGIFIVGAAVGIFVVMALIAVLEDVLGEWLEEYYGVDVSSPRPGSKETNVFKELKKWKGLLADELITAEDYDAVKAKRLEKVGFRKLSAVEAMETLRKAYEEELIDKDDFQSLKQDLINTVK